MDQYICSDRFTINAALKILCTLAITTVSINGNLEAENAERSYKVAGTGTKTIIIGFVYTVGTEYNMNDPEFGFALITSDLPIGVTLIHDFANEPDLTGEPNESKTSQVTIQLTIPETFTQKRFTFDGTVSFHPGTPT